MSVRIGHRYNGDFGAQIHTLRRLPPGPPLRVERARGWFWRLIFG